MRSIAAFLVVLALPAAAACPTEPPTFSFLRFDEDYGYLRDPTCRGEGLDGIKRIALDDRGDRYVTVGADVRIQVVSGNNLTVSENPGTNHGTILQRYHGHASFDLDPAVRVFLELKSNLESGREPGPRPADVNTLDVHQLFGDLRLPSGGYLRVGRQELQYGNSRRLFPRNGPNVRGSYDGAVFRKNGGDWRIDAGAFRPVEIGKGAFDDGTMDAWTAGYVYATHERPLAGPLGADLYAISLRRQGVAYGTVVGDERRQTLGTRLFKLGGDWTLDMEVAAQWGDFAGQAIRAWAFEAETSYRWASAWRPQALFRLGLGSGDRDPKDGRLQTFHPLFPIGAAQTRVAPYGVGNLRNFHAELNFQPHPRLRISIDADRTFRTDTRDALYGPYNNLIRPAAGSRARDVSHDWSAVASWLLDRHTILAVGTGVFYNDTFLRETTPPRTKSPAEGWGAIATLLWRF